MSKKRTIKDIEKELTELYPKKELTYQDYRDNTGDKELSGRLWGEFKEYQNQWNDLVNERKALMKSKEE